MKCDRLGKVQRVANTERRFGADPNYYFTRVELPDGGLVPLLLTEEQLEVAMKRATMNPEDLIEVLERDLPE